MMIDNKTIRIALYSICNLAVFTFAGCSSEESEEPKTASPAAESSTNKFYDAAVAKMAAAHPELSAAQHKQIVDHMTEGGVIGLGEVNSLMMDDLSQNAQRLVDAYKAALAKAKEAN